MQAEFHHGKERPPPLPTASSLIPESTQQGKNPQRLRVAFTHVSSLESPRHARIHAEARALVVHQDHLLDDHRRVRLLGRRRDGRRAATRSTSPRMVDGEPISVQTYARAHERMQRVYRELYRENMNPQILAQLNLGQRALDDLVTEMLLKREAAPSRAAGDRRRGPRGDPRHPDLPGRRPLRPHPLPERAPRLASHPDRVRGVPARDPAGHQARRPPDRRPHRQRPGDPEPLRPREREGRRQLREGAVQPSSRRRRRSATPRSPTTTRRIASVSGKPDTVTVAYVAYDPGALRREGAGRATRRSRTTTTPTCPTTSSPSGCTCSTSSSWSRPTPTTPPRTRSRPRPRRC